MALPRSLPFRSRRDNRECGDADWARADNQLRRLRAGTQHGLHPSLQLPESKGLCQADSKARRPSPVKVLGETGHHDERSGWVHVPKPWGRPDTVSGAEVDIAEDEVIAQPAESLKGGDLVRGGVSRPPQDAETSLEQAGNRRVIIYDKRPRSVAGDFPGCPCLPEAIGMPWRTQRRPGYSAGERLAGFSSERIFFRCENRRPGPAAGRPTDASGWRRRRRGGHRPGSLRGRGPPAPRRSSPRW